MARMLLVLAGIVALTVGGCDSYKPVELTDQPNELPSGPGLFTGEQGSFVIGAPSRQDNHADPRRLTESLPSAKPPAGYKPLE